MPKYDVQKTFDKYTINDDLDEADIFHLYDTGKECMEDNSGYHDARHFKLVAFNSETMEKCDCGIHDGIENISNPILKLVRIYADGSTLIAFNEPVKFRLSQCVFITT